MSRRWLVGPARGWVLVAAASLSVVVGGCVATGDDGREAVTSEATADVVPSPTSPGPSSVTTAPPSPSPPSSPALPQPTTVDDQPGTAEEDDATYAFPIEEGVRADYSDTHANYPATDIFAACGADVLAVTSGVVEDKRDEDPWDPATDRTEDRGGRFVALVGHDGIRYYTSHLESVTVSVGQVVETGDVIGAVGRSGNARDTPCHVHFGLSPADRPPDAEVRRGTIWPAAYLDTWRGGEDRRPES